MSEVKPGDASFSTGSSESKEGLYSPQTSNETFDESSDELDSDLTYPSTKVEHDFVPQSTTSENMEASNPPGMLIPCSACGTALEIWQVSCHNCGIALANDPAPNAVTPDLPVQQITEAFGDWFEKGLAAYNSENFSEAQNCFMEALARVKGISNAKVREVEVRKNLARCLQKLDKKSEAAEQYMLLSKLLGANAEKDYEQKARELARSTVDALSATAGDAIYRVPTRRESKLVPLYCSNCKQLLVEAEVYAFRRGREMTVRCFCGAEGIPMVRFDIKHIRALKDEPTLRLVRAQVLDAASDNVTGGRTRGTAIALAVLFGFIGGHKFYLGEYYFAAIYAMWFTVSWLLIALHHNHGFDYGLCTLSFVPCVVSWFEAVQMARTSRVTFNLTYNIERVLSKLPSEKTNVEPGHDVFDTGLGEEPPPSDEGFDDEMTSSSIKLRTIAPRLSLAEGLEPDSSTNSKNID